MKKVCLVADHRPFWREVEKGLGGVNARVTVVDRFSLLVTARREKPDLIVMGTDTWANLPPDLRETPALVIKAGSPPHIARYGDGGPKAVMAGWPMPEGKLLEITSRMLTIAPRRQFNALIRVFPRGEQISRLGRSVDFSLTGMSFRTEYDFRQGDEAEISFSVPDFDGTLRFAVEIMRTVSDGDGETAYGARFAEISPETRDILMKFVLKSA